MDQLKETINQEACAKCKGKCCILYGSPLMAQYEDNIELFAQFWMTLFKDVDVVPLFDPILSHQDTEQAKQYRQSLPSWIDTNMCPFCHPDTGCLVLREQRPDNCREYMCNDPPL